MDLLPHHKHESVGLVFAFFVAGWLVGSRWSKADLVARPIEFWVVTIAFPALVLVELPKLEITTDAAVPILGAWTVAALSALLVLAAARFYKWDSALTGTLLLIVPLGNTGFLGIAAVRALLGEDHVALALTFDQLGTDILLVTYGTYVASKFGEAAGGVRVMLKKIFSFPPLIAMLASVALRHWPLADWMNDSLGAIGDTVSYTAMLALGLRFRLSRANTVLKPALFGLAIRMLVMPTVAILMVAVVGDTSSIAWDVTTLQIAVPPMVMAGLLAARSGLNTEVATVTVGAGTLLAFVTLPLVGTFIA